MTIVFFNGTFCDSTHCPLSIEDRGWLLGDGLFETMRIYSGRVPFLEPHWNRLVQSAQFLEIPCGLSLESFKKIIEELIEKNGYLEKEGIIRISLSRGVGQRGLSFPKEIRETLLINIFPFLPSPKHYYAAHISSIVRNERSPLSKIKSLNYLENILARREAEKAGFDEAILLNSQARLCMASSANLFFIKNKTLYTPSIEEGALPGIMRATILDLAPKMAYQTQIGHFTLTDLEQADGIFLSNSVSGIVAIGKINEQVVNVDSTDRFRVFFQTQINQPAPKAA